jgi:hypothetical protein
MIARGICQLHQDSWRNVASLTLQFSYICAVAALLHCDFLNNCIWNEKNRSGKSQKYTVRLHYIQYCSTCSFYSIVILRIKEENVNYILFLTWKICEFYGKNNAKMCIGGIRDFAGMTYTFWKNFGAKLVPQNWKLVLSVEKKLPRILRRIILYNLEITFPRRLQNIEIQFWHCQLFLHVPRALDII